MITIAHIFYNQHALLPIHEKAWAAHPADAACYTIIDDASPLAASLCRPGLSIYRVTQDIPWNIAGARNLAFHTAGTDWVLCADIDHVVTAQALAQILTLDLTNPRRAYLFKRRDETGYVGVDAVINILMSRDAFFAMGGYDEDFSGHYGREETFFLQCLRHHRIEQVMCGDIFLEWYPRLGKMQHLARDKAVNSTICDAKLAQLREGRYRNGPRLRFDWSPV
jgi:hypothetical protein